MDTFWEFEKNPNKKKMVKKLRNKFVTVTTILLLMLFGSFWIINTLFTNYWNGIEIVEMLDWIAYSGIFMSNNESLSTEEWIRDITKDESPIAGIVVDAKGKIMSFRMIGQDTKIEVPESVLQKMCVYQRERKKIGKFYYSYTKLSDEMALLVVMNSSLDKFAGWKILGICVLLACAIVILEAIIFWLSKFVTKPAEQTFLREKQFISDAGHELKTPLGAISINAQALELEYEDNLYIRNIVSESNRMGRLLEKLLTLARLDEQEKVYFTKLNLSEICEEMALTYESVAFEKQVHFEFEINPLVEIWGNEDEIRQLLAILIDNAIKNTEQNGLVFLQCITNRRKGELIVSNSGVGIPDDILPHVFERFYTSDKARTTGSFGLGLAIAKAIVDRHKGTIKVSSIPNEKTTFFIVF